MRNAVTSHKRCQLEAMVAFKERKAGHSVFCDGTSLQRQQWRALMRCLGVIASKNCGKLGVDLNSTRIETPTCLMEPIPETRLMSYSLTMHMLIRRFGSSVPYAALCNVILAKCSLQEILQTVSSDWLFNYIHNIITYAYIYIYINSVYIFPHLPGEGC